ncbi:MAG: alpha/beta hydrolase [Actinomycetota bacterium]|nr:alpha/beta hydrolase [Actinomycetota bacterium]
MWITTADIDRIAVHDLGGSGPPILFCHATGFHGLVWQAVSAELSDSVHGISFDQRGHGDSGLPQDLDLDWSGFARDALAVVGSLGLERPIGVGHSSGATVLLLAEQLQPGTFAALYCYEPIIVPADPPLGPDPSNWLAAAARRRREVFRSKAEALASYSAKPPFSTWRPEVVAAYVDHGLAAQPDGMVTLRCQRDVEARVYEMASANNAFGRLAEVRCPVLVAAGADSESVTRAGIEVVARRLPLGRTEILASLGHFGPFEDPPAVSHSIRRFLNGLPGAGDASPV